MNIGNKIKVLKAAQHRVFTPKESTFLFYVINDTGDMSDAYDSMMAMISQDHNYPTVIVDGFTYDEHRKFSSSIVSKVKNETITIEDLEEINR